MEEELRYNEEAMEKIEIILKHDSDMIEAVSEISINKFIETDMADNIAPPVFSTLCNIDLLLIKCLTSDIEEDTLLEFIDLMQESKKIIGSAESNIDYAIKPFIPKNKKDMCANFIKAQLNILDIIDKHKSNILDLRNIMNLNPGPVLIRDEDEKYINPDFNWTNHNISVLINSHYFVQDIYYAVQKIKDILELN